MLRKLTFGCLGLLLSINSAFAIGEKHTAKILETKNAAGYTYLKVDEKGEQYWVAVPGVKAIKGQMITFNEQTWMKNFKSKSLNQTFEKIMFADLPKQKGISGTDNVHGIHGQNISKKKKNEPSFKPDPKFNDIFVAKTAPIKTNISEVYKKKAEFKNKNVEVEGHVLQVSNKVKGNTWVKIYNGTDAMIFRSANEDEKLEAGDKVRVAGTLNVDVNYGFGYSYEVIGVNGKFTILEAAKDIKKVEKKEAKK